MVYTETVTNTGSVPLTHIAVNQALFGEYEVKEGEMTVKGTEVIIPDLQPDESYTFTYSVPASYAEQGKLKNTAYVTTAEKVDDEDECTVSTAYLTITKTADSDVYNFDDTITYTNVITNMSSVTLDNVVVTEDNGKGEFDLAASEYGDKTITIKEDNSLVIDKLLPGDSVTLVYHIKAADVEHDEDFNVYSYTTAAFTSDINIEVMDDVEYELVYPQVTVTESPDKKVYGDIENIVYTYNVSNTGSCTLHNVVVSENFGKGTYEENENGTVNDKGDFVIPELDVGESVTLTYTVNAKDVPLTDGNTVVNIVTAVSDDKVSDNDTSTVEIVHYEISVTKVADKPVHVMNDVVVFTNVIKNDGLTTLTNVTAQECMNGKFNLPNGAVILGDHIVIAELAPGESYTYTFAVKADDDTVENDLVNSTVTVTVSEHYKDGSSDAVTATADANVKIVYPNIKVTKEVEYRDYTIGEEVVWVDTVTNNGDVTLVDVVVTESLNGIFTADKDYETTENTMIIPKLEPGESVTFTFTTAADSENISDNTCYCTVEDSSGDVSDSAEKSVPVIAPVEPDIQTETEVTAETESETVPESDVETTTETETESEIESVTETETGTESEPEIITETESETETRTDTDTVEGKVSPGTVDKRTDTDIETPVDSEITTDTESEVPVTTDSEISVETESETPGADQSSRHFGEKQRRKQSI